MKLIPLAVKLIIGCEKLKQNLNVYYIIVVVSTRFKKIKKILYDLFFKITNTKDRQYFHKHNNLFFESVFLLLNFQTKLKILLMLKTFFFFLKFIVILKLHNSFNMEN